MGIVMEFIWVPINFIRNRTRILVEAWEWASFCAFDYPSTGALVWTSVWATGESCVWASVFGLVSNLVSVIVLVFVSTQGSALILVLALALGADLIRYDFFRPRISDLTKEISTFKSFMAFIFFSVYFFSFNDKRLARLSRKNNVRVSFQVVHIHVLLFDA
jgi:hypothetical protein